MNKSGFTLAETLITLSIIGIVAAMTLPSVLIKKRNLELETSFKTAYSLISQAVLRMSSDNPSISETYCSTAVVKSTEFAEDFSKYFQTTKTYYTPIRDLKHLGYKESYFKQPYSNSTFNPDAHNNGAFFVKNGMMIASSGCWWWAKSSIPVDFIVDTNGVKGPNRLGYDVFYFQIIKGNILLPATHRHTFAEITSQLERCCNFNEASTCSITADNGTACSHFALKNEYPQNNSKKYWENLN